MRDVNQSFAIWKDLCQNGSAPQINAAAQDVRDHIEEAADMLDQMQKANGAYNLMLFSSIHVIFTATQRSNAIQRREKEKNADQIFVGPFCHQ